MTATEKMSLRWKLEDFTDDQLRNELKRRSYHRHRQNKADGRVPRYAYAEGVVVQVHGTVFSRASYWVKVDEGVLESTNLNRVYKKGAKMDLYRGAFSKETAPGVGDRVRFRGRITKSCPTGFNWFSIPKITEIIKKKEEI